MRLRLHYALAELETFSTPVRCIVFSFAALWLSRPQTFTVGHAPYVALSAGKTDTGVIFQTEALADPGATPEDKGTLEYTCAFTTAANATFDLVYSKTMYPDGVNVSVDIEGAVTTKVLGEKVEVDCGESTGQIVVVSISPK